MFACAFYRVKVAEGAGRAYASVAFGPFSGDASRTAIQAEMECGGEWRIRRRLVETAIFGPTRTIRTIPRTTMSRVSFPLESSGLSDSYRGLLHVSSEHGMVEIDPWRLPGRNTARPMPASIRACAKARERSCLMSRSLVLSPWHHRTETDLQDGH